MHRLTALLARHWADIDREAASERAGHPGRDARASQILVVAAVVLTLAYFFCKPSFFLTSTLGVVLAHSSRLARYKEFFSHSYWCIGQTLLLTAIPLWHLRRMGERPLHYGLARQPTATPPDSPVASGDAAPQVSLRVYLGLLLLILPVILAASFTPTFQRAYPLYRLAGRSLFELIAWEVQYVCMFFAIEFFFRGYLLFGLRRAFGSQAIFVAMLPYCMWHFSKPPIEALASILAGLLLGTLALASRGIWGGVLLHVAVALTMDFSAVLQKHGLPSTSTFFSP
jgi:membrane protease YdiL (CAAX protease family)